MKISVDLTICQNHGQCAYSAPNVFALDAEGQLAYRAHATETYESGEIDDALAEDVQEAIDMCPVQAIRSLSEG